MLFDSHTHFNNEDLTSLERQALFNTVDKAVADGKMSAVVDIGFDLSSSEMAAEHARTWPWCYAAVGCHPHDAKTMDEEKLLQIKRLAAEEKVVAIGEIGLDFHYDLSDRDTQRYWFRRQIRLANELMMPITIHAREADQEVRDILTEEGAFSKERLDHFGHAGVLLHCFSGSAQFGLEYVKMGAYISVAGPVTYKNNKKTVAMVESVPIERLLVETDAPYLTPVPFRGKRNTPLFVEYTARKVAEIKGLTFEEVAAATRDNAMRFYGIGEDKPR